MSFCTHIWILCLLTIQKNKNKNRFCVPYINVERQCQYRNHCQMWQPTSYSYGSKIRIPVWGHIFSGHFNNPVFPGSISYESCHPSLSQTPTKRQSREAVIRKEMHHATCGSQWGKPIKAIQPKNKSNPSKPASKKQEPTKNNRCCCFFVDGFKHINKLSGFLEAPESQVLVVVIVDVADQHWITTWKYRQIWPKFGAPKLVPLLFNPLAIHSWMCRSCHPAVYWV